MTRLHRWLPALLASALAFGACGGDDDGNTPTTDSGVDSGAKDGGAPDSSTPATDAGSQVKVTNVGTSCTSVSTCTGAAPRCDESLTFGPTGAALTIKYPGSSVCTATCAQTSECGTGGLCPVGDLLKLSATAAALVGSTGTCMKACTLGTSGACSAGYACVNLKILGMQLAPDAGLPPGTESLPQLNNAFCIPLAGDAGAAQTLAPLTGIDAGL